MAHERVLIVDDLPEHREMLQDVLAPHAYRIRVAHDGLEALEMALAEPPDLVLMDVDMPRMNGLEACARLKEDARTRLVPVILLTALGARDDRVRGLQAGCDDFLTKPVDVDELVARTRSALRTKAAVDQLEEAENVLFSLARALDAKDPYTAGHSGRVAVLAERLGRATGLPPDELVRLRRAALLHDIGKIGVPGAVLNKPGRLTEEEFEVIKLHPVVGEAICRPLRTLGPVLHLIRGHHERPDGRGYPDGLRARDMSPALHGLVAADVYDALTSQRAYRRALSHDEALVLMRDEARVGAWDAGMVELLVKTLAEPA